VRSFDTISPNITPEIIRGAVQECAIHQINNMCKDSPYYDVIVDVRSYPLVALMGIAFSLAEGTGKCPRLIAGDGTACFESLRNLFLNKFRRELIKGEKQTERNRDYGSIV
jgi:hypothetical protein